MADFDRYRMRVKYKDFAGLSGCGFRNRATRLEDLFPTADEVVLAMKGCFHKLGGSASIIYEVPGMRFDVAESDRVLELAVPNPKGDYVGVIIDVLALDVHHAHGMMDDIEASCQIVPAKLSEVMGILEMSQEDYIQRLRDSVRFLTTELHR